ncbi:MAG: FAD-dependent monooxygenase [Alphaproteobacteria bacterium]
MRTQVAIIGAGPAGLFLAHILNQSGIACIVLERRTRAYVQDRVRAGVLERVTVDLLEKLGLGARMRREGLAHGGTNMSSTDECFASTSQNSPAARPLWSMASRK